MSKGVAIVGRRGFLKSGVTAAGALLVAFHLPVKSASVPAVVIDESAVGDQADEINAWIFISATGVITVRVAKAEMGQGVLTALPMIIADELEADWSMVRAEFASANRNYVQSGVYRDMATNSSTAIRVSMPYLQLAGAEARQKLIKAAAEKWQVSVDACYAEYGKVYHRPDGRWFSYGTLACLAAELSVANVRIKTPDQFSLMGLPTKRLDTPAKVNGSAVFGMDVRLDGMLYAAIIHSPVEGGVVRNVLFNAIRNMPGVVQMVRLESSVAVVAKTFWEAKVASEKLPVTWRIGDQANSYSDALRDQYIATLDSPGVIVSEQGETTAALDSAETVIQSDYFLPYLAHAAMEPLNCTVRITAARLDLWAGVQNADAALAAAAQASGIRPENVYIHNCFLGGGFGRRANMDFVSEAVTVAKAVGKPVQLIWTREQDMRSGRYRPMAAIRFQVGVDLKNTVVAYTNHSVSHSILKDLGAPLRNGIDPTSVEGLANMPYLISHKKIAHTIKNTHLTSWFWRSVGNSQNAFAMECFVDEMAEATKLDPMAFRKLYLAHRPDLLKVLNVLEQKSQWRHNPAAGRAKGMAIHACFGTIVGQVAEVSISSDGGLMVHKFTSVVDCGHVVNPLSAEMQIESGIIYGLTAALFGKISIENGEVVEGNFDTYSMLKLRETPLMETFFMPADSDRWGGLGEPGLPCVAPAVANAIYKLTKRRIRSLPIADYFLQPV
ncbi:MAG: molybdopterin-dependent oxidoreductase [Pseudomonadales bacterium]|nr:molybdopterin-dependent oxidoreductase [Pseudomonadales bacterium]